MLVLAAIVGALFAAPGALAATFTVNSAADTDDGVCDFLSCTLREAINDANSLPGHDFILFQIGVGGSETIFPLTPLPNIDNLATIDGTTQTGYAGAPLITIDGTFASPNTRGLNVNAGGTTIRGLAIGGFGQGIVLGSGGNDVQANYLGIDAGGSTANENGIGVYVLSSGNRIGGDEAAERNVISGNTFNGVEIAAGTDNFVYGNYIGTDASGNFAVPNVTGVYVRTNSNTIGGEGVPVGSQRNVISGNSGIGVVIDQASSNTIEDNYIGTDVDGTSAVENKNGGVQIVGGPALANANTLRLNVISGNGNSGLVISTNEANTATNNVVSENLIGTDATGEGPLGNAGPGVLIAIDAGLGNNSIGSGNVIAFNSKGIAAQGNTAGNNFRGNSIHDNTGLGIDLGDDGVTANDLGDADTGANDLVNFPVLETADRNDEGAMVVTGTYDGSLPDALYELDFYASESCDSSGFSEGAKLIGSTSNLADGSGDFTFNTDNALTGHVAQGDVITATATDADGNTSEFSQCLNAPVDALMNLAVDTTSGDTDGDCSDGDCSLGDAITVANATPSSIEVQITFALPASPPYTISPTTELPPITRGVLLDGYTQSGATPGTPIVRVDGSALGLGGFDGLRLDNPFPSGTVLGGSTIRGLSITNFSGVGISLDGGPPSVVDGNYIGIAPDGTAAGNGDGFGDGGIAVWSGDNRIGGTTPAARNVISGNKGIGIDFHNQSGNVVTGNYIGTNPAGTAAVPNIEDGIAFQDVNFQMIGGSEPGAGNLISGNGANGMFFNAGYEFETGFIQGNTIGLAADGATALPNVGAGIYVTFVDDLLIGGATPGAGNVIAGNGGTGVLVDSSDGVRIQGNLIGLNAAGDAAVPNGTSSVIIDGADDVQVGGTTAGARNVISGGPTAAGVLISGGAGTTVQGNYIGTDKTGELAVGNGTGVLIDSGADHNTVGGVVPGAGNVISGNTRAVQVDTAGAGNRIVGNSIGTDKDETDVIPNDIGVEVDATDGTIVGSTSPGGGNVIAGSDDVGILVFVGSNSNVFAGNFVGTDRTDTLDLGNGTGMRFDNTGGDNNIVGPNNVFAHSFDATDGYGIELLEGTGNRISANSIHDNALRGIFLAAGANGDQEAPVLSSSVRAGTTTTIVGSLSSTQPQPTTYFIEFFRTPSCTGEPQGQKYLGFKSVTIDEGQTATFSFGSGLPGIGDEITATATNSTTLDTSELSSCVATVAGSGLLSGSVMIDPPVTPVDLTARGTNDWAIWGYANGGTSTSLAPDTRKAGGSAISDLTNIDPAPSVPLRGLGQFASPPFLFDWSDGNAPPSETNAQGGLQHNGEPPADLSTLGHGFAFDVPADTSPRTLTVYVATNRADGELVATLSDDSAAEFSNTLVRAVDLRSGVYTITYAAASPNQTLHVSWIETFDNCAAFRCDNAAIYAVALSDAVYTADNVTLDSTPSSAAAGAPRVKLSSVSPGALLQAQSSQQAAPVNQTPVNQTPINQTAATNAPVNQTPINQTPVNQTPVNQSGFADLTQSIAELGDIPLSSIPLLRTGGWAAVLTGTTLAGIPQQNVTLRDVYALNPAPGPLQPNATNPLKIGELDLSLSTLGRLPAMAFTLGKLELNDIPMTTPTGTTTWDVGWCQSSAVLGVSCSGTASVLSAGLQGAPVNQTPVNQTPVNQTLINALAAAGTPVNQTPVNQTPVNQTRIGALPVNQTPVNQTPVNQTPINQLSLEAILAANAPVNQTPVNQTPVNQLPVNQTIVNCSKVNCATATLRDAYLAGAINPGVTLGDLRIQAPASMLANWTIADLRDYGSMTIGDLLESLPQPNSFTLADVLLLVLGSPGAQGLSFESLNLFDTGLPEIAMGGSTIDYRAQFDVNPNGGPSGGAAVVKVTSTLPTSFLYVAGTSKLTSSAGTCATATAIGDPAVATLTDAQLELTWTIDTTVGNGYAVCFTARPGIVLGPQAASVSAQPTGRPETDGTPASVAVGDTLEPNGAPATAPELFNDSFYLSYLTSSSDVDYARFAAPPAGTVMTFHLSHLPADYDLVVYGPPDTLLRPNIASAVPLDEPPVIDDGVDPTHATDALPSQTLDDLRLQPSMPMVGVSAMRGTDPEDIVVVSQGGGGVYTVQVTGYNSATSPKPYMLRVSTTPPRVTSNVAARSGTGTVGPALPNNLPAGLNTVFLVNRQQLQARYDSTQASNVINALQSDSSAFTNLGFPNVILSVDRFATVQTAYTNWNAHPGDPAAANGVVAAINAVLDSQIRTKPNGGGLKYLVIVGGDQVIPFARLDDFTVTASNEAGYANTFGINTDLFAALNAGQMLSDDPYGDVNPVPYLNRQLYIPELAVGRLVETPGEIVTALNRFVSPGVQGHLDPTTALATGYDFLLDGANAVNTAVRGRVGGTNPTGMLGNSWTWQNLIDNFLPAGGAPSITSLNGHASHYQFQPPAGATGTTRSQLFTTGELTGSSSALTNRLVFSMGCHAGLSVADAVVTAGATLDWPQAYAQKGAGAYLGNTGYGYGDSLVIAYSEELNRQFAQRVALGSTVGNALVAAKQGYYGGLGVFGVYDEKSMAEFTLYGLPMWSVSGPGNTPAPALSEGPRALSAQEATTATVEQTTTTESELAPLAIVPDQATGLEAETFDVTPAHTENPTPPLGTYWSAQDGVQVTQLRPIQPKLYIPLTGTTGHGALITQLKSIDEDCVDPVFARPLVDLGVNESELAFGDVAFPSKLQTVRTFVAPTGLQQRLVLVTGQFFTLPCAANPDPQVGVQRLFSHVAGRVFRSTSGDYISPAFQQIEATAVGDNAAFAVDVTDLTPSSAGQVKQVVVGVRSGAETDWTFANLAQSAPGSARWTGGVPISDIEFEYFVQGVDAAGNVGVSTNKGFYYDGRPAPPTPPAGHVSGSLEDGDPVNGWNTNEPTLIVDAPNGVTVEASIDGGPFGTPPSTITGDGLHTIDLRGSNGDTATLFAAVDTTAPEIVIGTPAAGGEYVLNSIVKADYICRDSGSGVVTQCNGHQGTTPVPNGGNIDTSSLGTKTFTVDGVTDAAGRSTPANTVTYTVGYRPILFSSSRTGGGDIYSMKPDGSGLVRLTTSTALDEQPVWSPDGSKIAFASKRADPKGTLDIYVMDANGQNAQRLTTAIDDDTTPAWSPDGTKIAFQSRRDANIEIYVMNADGTNQTRLTFSSNQDLDPAWSPNGQKIAFASNRNGGPNIWVMNANGTSPAQLTSTTQPEGHPSWSSDGTKIAFNSKRSSDAKSGTSADIFVMNANGGTATRLAAMKADDLDPVWSRDNQKIVFTAMRDGNAEIYIMNANGSNQVRLTTNAAFDGQPDW